MPFPFTTEHGSFPCSFLKAKSKWTPLAELHQAGKFKKLHSLQWPRFVRPNLHTPMAKLSFLRSWPLLIPECLFPKTLLLPGSFPAVQSGLWHIRKNIPLSSPLHSQNLWISLVSPVFLEKYCSVFRPRSHIFFQSLQNLPDITFTVAHCLPFCKAFPCVRESLVPWSWGRHFPHSKLPGVYQALIFYLITVDFGRWKPRGQRPPCPGISSTLRTCSQNCFSQWNFKYGTALTLGIETPGSFPLGYEKFIIFAISQILIVTRCCDERQNVLQAQT